MLDLYIDTNDYKGADFGVCSTVATYEGIPVPNKKVLYRDDNNGFLNIVSLKYKPVDHRSMIDALRSIIAYSGLNYESVQETITTDKSGAKCFVKYVLPNEQIQTPDGDTAALSFLGVNSFDGTFAFILSVGARQSACMNGQVFTKNAATLYKSRHCQGLSVGRGADILRKGVEVLESQQKLWQDWYKSPVESMVLVNTIFARAAGIEDYFKFVAQNRTSKSLDYMRQQFLKVYKPRLGNNYWAVYNAMTDWSTHASGTKKTKSHDLLKIRREAKVASALNMFP